MNNAYKRSIRLIIIRVAANVLTLAAIVVAMYMAYLHPGESLLVFCQWFFGITVVVWFAARKLCYHVRATLADRDESMVLLPGQKKRCIVRWKIAAPQLALLRPQRQE